MARIRGPYSAAFPVNFTSKGDTTRDAFKKHMDELARVYGILTDFDKDIANTEGITGDLTKHINSTNPHPNYKPSISWTDLSNKPGLDDLSGTLSASKVRGSLSNATIASGNVSGLETFVNGKIPPSSGDGITEADVKENGYVGFGNGLIVQWGKATPTQHVETWTVFDVAFPRLFQNACYGVMLTICRSSFAAHLIREPGISGFSASILEDNISSILYYIAIGV